MSTRRDGDSWDLASGVGTTATAVAVARAPATRAGQIDDRWAEPLVRAVDMPHFLSILDGDPAGVSEIERMAAGMAVRTRYFDEFLADAAAAGIRQVVILASGLDARAYRLHWPTGTVVYETDQPAVIDFKVATLAGLGAEPTTEVRNVGIDLRDDWPEALQSSGFDTARPTAWIAEGLLIYLPADAQDRLFDSITALSAPELDHIREQIGAKCEVIAGSREKQRGIESDIEERIVRVIRRRPLNLPEIVDSLGIPPAMVSKHLAHLEEQGRVTARHYGSELFYQLTR